MYFIYIIYSKKLNRYYIGTTDDIEKRLNEHNAGFYRDSFTVNGIPWELCLDYGCESSEKAYSLEKFIKRMKSRKFLEKVISNPDVLRDIQNKL
ncbi:GIY-YIG nuclease family protein [Flavobacterium sp. GT3R68]|uniref:GIY-YIG nuclease family protein n=1 Tax=Flavobacterium sp. GT3R68 TaxID=2594437 RepID=UPI000F85F085|nr:GIY-YIG nuclease family protein [Flavobacterium sp. GT3R68]RTY87502.1 GIY-YIG nuclease family protein [Flavobacterium sp. GSN2]TRW90413.1 GIY-YIG nuclease family protein [Flavobacterium sp. GT3R68]